MSAKRFATNVWLSVLLALGLGALFTPASVSARGGLAIGFADGLLSGSDAGQRGTWLARAAEVNGDVVRINVPWASIAKSKPKPAQDQRMQRARQTAMEGMATSR